MKPFLHALLVSSVASVLQPASSGRAQEVSATPAAGYFTLTAHALGDTWLAVPLTRRPVWIGRITAVSADQLTLDGTLTPTDDQFAATAAGPAYYAQFVTGALRGLIYPVRSNTAGALTLNTSGDDLTNHALGSLQTGADNGDVVRLYPAWTVAALLTDEDAAPVLAPVATAPGAVYLAGDQMRLPDQTTTAVEKRPLAVHAYIAGQGWRAYPGDAGEDSGAAPLLPGEAFVLRRHAETSALVTGLGYVAPVAGKVRLPALAAGEEMDIAISLLRPAEATLEASGLNAVLEPSPDDFTAADRLLVFEPGRRGFSPPPTWRFQVTGDDWRLGVQPVGDTVMNPGQGYLLRLSGARPIRYWQQAEGE